LPRTRTPWILLGLAVSYVLYAVPVMNSENVRDPKNNYFTDHLRYRYCSLLVLENPLHSLTVPMSEQFKADRTHKYKENIWPLEPCHQGGLVHLTIHAPFQLLLEWGAIERHQATGLYVLFTLLIVHLCVGLILRSPDRWWLAVPIYFFLIRTSLAGLQTPIAFLFGWLTTTRLAQGRTMDALGWYSLTASAYGRWVIWAPPMAYRLIITARESLAALRAQLSTTRGKAVAAMVAVIFACSAVATVLVFMSRIPPRLVTIPPLVTPATITLLAVWTVVFIMRWKGLAGPFSVATYLFLLLYRKNDLLFWYGAPLYALLPLAQGRRELALITLTTGLASEMVLRGPNLLQFNDVAVWLLKQWGVA